MVLDWLDRKYETFSLVNSWYLMNKVKLACDLQSLSRSNYARIMFFRCHCPNSGSLILGGQIMHINEGKGKLALFSTKDNVLLTLDPSYSFPIDLLSLSNFTFYPFHFPSSTSTLHRYIDSSSISH